MLFPGLGSLTADEDGFLRSSPTTVPVLGQAACIVLEDYEDDPAPDDFHRAVAAFLVADSSTLDAAAPAVFAYYEDTRDCLHDDEEIVSVASPTEIWRHVTFPDEVLVMRDDDDGPVYVSLECECAWEVEHGLQLVFRDGRITRVGMYDGHMKNDDDLLYDGMRKVNAVGIAS